MCIGLDPCVLFGHSYRLGAFPWYYLILVVGLVSVLAITRLRDLRESIRSKAAPIAVHETCGLLMADIARTVTC